MSAAGAVLSACQRDTVTEASGLSAAREFSVAAAAFDTVKLDDRLLAIEKGSPGFGGMYLDSTGALVIVHTNKDALGAALAATQAVIGDAPQLHARRIVLRLGKYSFPALANYRNLIEKGIDHAGLIWSDLDEVNNRVTFGVASDAVARTILTFVVEQHLPVDAVAAVVVAPLKPAGLQDYQDTTAGALLIGFTNGGGCTLGFNATRWGTARYMVTAGHCTPTMGAVDTSFWAAQEYGWTRHAQEFSDPAYGALAGCPSGDTCRNSDAAMFQWKDSSQTFGLGLIATPSSADTLWGGDGTYGPYDLLTHFNIIGEAADSWLIPGALVSKIGQTTAFTEGRVTGSCVTAYSWPTTGKDVLCQVVTNVPAYQGDSGGSLMYGWPAPQTPPTTSTAYLAGIVSKSDGFSFSSYSSIAGIFRDFGSLKTYPSKPCC